MSRRIIFTVLTVALCLILAGCGGSPTPAPAQPQNPPAQGETAAPAQPAEATAVPATPTEEVQRGPGSFDLPDPTIGLDGLPGYTAELSLIFDGTRDGQPYHMDKTYTVVYNRNEDARLLEEKGVRADSTSSETFSGIYQGIRYHKTDPSQPCVAGIADPQLAPFSPAAQLPRLLGAEAAGQETVDGIAADVYTFDQRAIDAGEAATATGKVWVAQSGGYVVKYELSMESDTVFGPGITGKQIWGYTISEETVDPLLALPDDCPLPLTGVPTMSDATDLIALPGEIRYQTASAKDAIAAFYSEQLASQDYLPQGEAVETAGGTRWMFGKQESDGASVMLLTVKPSDTGSEVRVTRILTEAPPAQGQ